MDDRGFAFEERKQENKKYNNTNEMEYNKGSGGDGPKTFYSVKTNVYSRECYSDPNLPGKMICKETNYTSGYDPFNKQSNFNKSKENIYTKEDINEKSMYDLISEKIKGIFSSNFNENAKNKVQNDEDNYNFRNEKNTHNSHQYNQAGFKKNSLNADEIDPEFETSGRSNFFSRDPFLDEFERLLGNIQSAFQIGSFIKDEVNEHFTGRQFANGSHFDNNNCDDNDNRDHSFHRSYYKFEPSENYYFTPGHDENKKDFENLNTFGQRNQSWNQKKQNEDKIEIKYSDSKIYDV